MSTRPPISGTWSEDRTEAALRPGVDQAGLSKHHLANPSSAVPSAALRRGIGSYSTVSPRSLPVSGAHPGVTGPNQNLVPLAGSRRGKPHLQVGNDVIESLQPN